MATQGSDTGELAHHNGIGWAGGDHAPGPVPAVRWRGTPHVEPWAEVRDAPRRGCPDPGVTVGPDRIRAAPLGPRGTRRRRHPDHDYAHDPRSGVNREPGTS